MTNAELPLVYIAGPYTNPEPIANIREAITVASALADSGLVAPIVPHLTMLWHLVSPRPLEEWYALDLALLARCDYLIRLPGASRGADTEVRYARVHDIPVYECETAAASIAELLGDIVRD